MFKKLKINKILDLNIGIVFAGLVLAIYAYLMFPTLIFPGEAIYEMASSFFYTTYYSDDLVKSLMHTDIGYLMWLPMSVFIIFSRLLGFTQYIFDITQVTSTLLLIFYSIFFCSNSFKSLISSNIIRLIICLFIGIFVILRSMELVVFMDATYAGYIFLLLMLFYEDNQLSKYKLLFFSILSILIICSKATFIVFGPIYILACFIFWCQKKYKLFTYSTVSLSAVVISFSNLLKFSHNGIEINYIKVINNSLIYFISGFSSRTGIFELSKFTGYSEIIFTLVTISLIFLIYFSYKKNKKITIFILVAIFTSFSSLILLFANETTKNWYVTFDHFKITLLNPPDVRHFFFLNITIIFTVCCLINVFINNRYIKYIFVIIFLTVLLLSNFSRNGFLIQSFKLPPEQWRFGQWSLLHKKLDKEGLLITGYPETIFFSSGKTGFNSNPINRTQPLNNVGIWDTKFDQSFVEAENSSYLFKDNGLVNGIIIFPRTQEPTPLRLFPQTATIISQEFYSQNNYLNGISINIGTEPKTSNNIWLVSIIDDSNKLIHQEAIDMYHYKISSYLGFHTLEDRKLFIKFDPQKFSMNKKYTLNFNIIEGINRNNIFIQTRKSFDNKSILKENSNIYPNIELQFNLFYTSPSLYAIDSNGNTLALGTQLTPEQNLFKYYIFENYPIKDLAKIKFKDQMGNDFIYPSRIMFFGKKLNEN